VLSTPGREKGAQHAEADDLRNDALRWYVVLSVAAALLLALFAWTESRRGLELAAADRLLLGGVLAACCLFGVARSVRPGAFKILEVRRSASTVRTNGCRPRVGHHPDCERFAAHRVTIGGTARCAGCIGLAIGSVMGLGLAAAYLIGAASISADLAKWMLVLGIVMVTIAVIETAWPRRSGGMHVVTNLLMPIGFVATTIAATELSASVYVGLMAVLFSFLWLDTRIVASKTVHARTCSLCPLGCKSY
jgi:hypothetical protein